MGIRLNKHKPNISLPRSEAHHLSPGCELGARLPACGVGRGCSCPSISGASFSPPSPRKGGISFNSTITLSSVLREAGAVDPA